MNCLAKLRLSQIYRLSDAGREYERFQAFERLFESGIRSGHLTLRDGSVVELDPDLAAVIERSVSNAISDHVERTRQQLECFGIDISV